MLWARVAFEWPLLNVLCSVGLTSVVGGHASVKSCVCIGKYWTSCYVLVCIVVVLWNVLVYIVFSMDCKYLYVLSCTDI